MASVPEFGQLVAGISAATPTTTISIALETVLEEAEAVEERVQVLLEQIRGTVSALRLAKEEAASQVLV